MQRGDARQRVGDVGRAVRRLVLDAPTAPLLRAVHRVVGLAEHVGGVGDVACERDPDAGADEDGLAVDLEGLLEDVDDPLHGRVRVALGVNVVDEHDELVAAEAPDGVGGAQLRRGAASRPG